MQTRKKRVDRTIEDLAFAFLNGKYAVRGIINKFGWAEAQRSVTAMAETLLLVDPNHNKAAIWLRNPKEDKLR